MLAILVGTRPSSWRCARSSSLAHDGEKYDAAVLAAGHCGFGLGAAPTAIANMGDYRPFWPLAYGVLVVPMVGAFFIDIVSRVGDLAGA